MNTRFVLAACVAALLTGSASAPAVAKSPVEPARRQCFFTRDVNGFAAPDEKTLFVRAGVKDVYQFEMFGPCPDLNWNQELALVSRSSTTICSGMDAEVITRTSIGPQRCHVRSVRKLTPAEIAALPSKSRP